MSLLTCSEGELHRELCGKENRSKIFSSFVRGVVSSALYLGRGSSDLTRGGVKNLFKNRSALLQREGGKRISFDGVSPFFPLLDRGEKKKKGKEGRKRRSIAGGKKEKKNMNQ